MSAGLAALAMLAEPARQADARDLDIDRVARHHDGDRDAFAEIYRAHVAAVYRRLTRILGPIPEREDLTQDVFVALHRALPKFRGESALSTWIQRIAINTALDHLRSRVRRPAAPVDIRILDKLSAPQASPEARAEHREQLAHVFACLAKIKPKKRIALLLRVVDGLSFEDIGQLVDASPDAVAKRVQHGQRELDALLARREGA
jgi:RNA polymerase sigma-70 factor (ECF subfamily)